jgi:hypothetical protein
LQYDRKSNYHVTAKTLGGHMAAVGRPAAIGPGGDGQLAGRPIEFEFITKDERGSAA